MKPFLISLLLIFSFYSYSDACEHSKWGEGDELGNANLLTKELVLEASDLIKTGKVYSLGLVIDQNTPAYPPRSLSLSVVQPTQQFGKLGLPNATYNDDMFHGWLGIGSQIDGLGHIGGTDAIFYNCHDGKEFSQTTGLTKLGIEKIPPIVTRGVLVDMARFFKKDFLEAGETFDVEDVIEALELQDVTIEEGDVVIFHTGWTEAKYFSDPELWGSGTPGPTGEVSSFLASKNVVAAGADTWSYDVVPPIDLNEPYPGHQILLKENGIYILEAMSTGELAKDNVYEFLFVLGQAKVRGAVQMIINPIAIN
uniref:Putative cyclase n=1 Tax=uncultured marine bacterium HF10_05C07 TaxID=415443 RepID=A4GJK0_9BACT|nr:putative cyclase [uncultured marine bacterium HF10_05C07]